jgi:hypothetical protein
MRCSRTARYRGDVAVNDEVLTSSGSGAAALIGGPLGPNGTEARGTDDAGVNIIVQQPDGRPDHHQRRRHDHRSVRSCDRPSPAERSP